MPETTLRTSEGTADVGMRGMMLPNLVLRDFLDEQTVASLVAYTLAREQTLKPTKVGRAKPGRIDPATRFSLATSDLGPFQPILESKLLSLAADLAARLRTTPAERPQIELQLVAHNDGAFYKRHIDTQTTPDSETVRVLSGVYYFHAMPKAFSGGALRLYAIGNSEDFVDIEPTHNSLLVFPSWAPHEVMPVTCQSKRFIDSRFAVNCWINRGTAAPAQTASISPGK